MGGGAHALYTRVMIARQQTDRVTATHESARQATQGELGGDGE